jgi:hypothetical protein
MQTATHDDGVVGLQLIMFRHHQQVEALAPAAWIQHLHAKHAVAEHRTGQTDCCRASTGRQQQRVGVRAQQTVQFGVQQPAPTQSIAPLRMAGNAIAMHHKLSALLQGADQRPTLVLMPHVAIVQPQ